jgi:hypothetical protein
MTNEDQSILSLDAQANQPATRKARMGSTEMYLPTRTC